MQNTYKNSGKPLKIPGKLLVTRNTGREFRCDLKDFEAAKWVIWYEYKGEIVTKNKVRFEDYVAIRGTKVSCAPEWDFRREFYSLT